MPVVRGQVRRGTAASPGRGTALGARSRYRGRSCPWIFLEEAAHFLFALFGAKVALDPGKQILSLPPAACISVCWRSGNLFITMP